MTVVVTQVSFKVAFQLGDAPVEEALPTVREASIEFDFDGPVLTHGIREPVCLPIWADKRVAKRIIVQVNTRLSKANGS